MEAYRHGVNWSKAPPAVPPFTLNTQFKDIVENTCNRCTELSRMIFPDLMRASARVKTQCRRQNLALLRDVDVPHDCIIDDEDIATHWLNR